MRKRPNTNRHERPSCYRVSCKLSHLVKGAISATVAVDGKDGYDRLIPIKFTPPPLVQNAPAIAR